jgi:hypothetical protein
MAFSHINLDAPGIPPGRNDRAVRVGEEDQALLRR